MGLPKQQPLPLTTSLRGVFHAEGQRLLVLAREVIQAEVKQADDFADSIGIPASQLSQALNGAGKNFSLTWLPALLHVDRRRRVLEHTAALVGCKVEEKRPLTPDEKLRALLRKLRERGVDVEHLEREAYAEES